MEAESASLDKRAEKLSLQHSDKRAKLSKDLQELERWQAIPADPQLEKLIQRAGQYRSDCEQLEQTAPQLAALDDQIDELRQQIAGPFGIVAAQVESLPLPLLTSVQEFGDEYATTIEALRQAANDHKQAKQELSRSREELKQFDATQRVPDRQALRKQRNRRDDGWRLIRQSYFDRQPVESQVQQWLGEGSASLPDRYEQEVREADGLSDDCQEKAELVARREQIGAEVARFENRVAEAQEELKKCQTARDQLDASWRETWGTCGLSPKSPEAMAEWLRLQAQLSEKLRNRLEIDSRLGQFNSESRHLRNRSAPRSVTTAIPMAYCRWPRSKAARPGRRIPDGTLESGIPVQRRSYSNLARTEEKAARQQEALGWALERSAEGPRLSPSNGTSTRLSQCFRSWPMPGSSTSHSALRRSESMK